jgi:thiol-disulfide isomerase/thioredoxin
MKRFLGLIFLLTITFGCQKKAERIDYVINGTVKDVFNGVRVYLNKIDENGQAINIDKAMVMDEVFSFKGNVDYPKLYSITIDGTQGRYDFMIENAVMQLTLDSKQIGNSELLGSVSNDVLKKYITKMTSYNEEYSRVREIAQEAYFVNDTLQIAKANADFQKITETITNYVFEFIEENNKSHAILPLLSAQSANRNSNIEKLVATFEKVDSTIVNTPEGKVIAGRINLLKEILEAEKATAIGAIAPNFSAPTPNGEILSLNEVITKGSVTIIDFWAAWCGPCRKENPNIVKIYEKYHSKGLEIIGVGLDGARGQQNPKEAWLKAIKDDNLTWHQVSNLNYFDEIARTYNVNGIPAMFIVDDKGEILAKNLRGLALENKIAELLE